MRSFQTRQLDLGSNNISNLSEFRHLQLNTLEQLSLASNQVRIEGVVFFSSQHSCSILAAKHRRTDAFETIEPTSSSLSQGQPIDVIQ